MRCFYQFFAILSLLFIACLDEEQKIAIGSDEVYSYEDFFDFALGEDAVDFARVVDDPKKFDLEAIGTFKAKHISYREIVFFNFDKDSLPVFDADALKEVFPRERFYALTYDNGLTAVFKFSSVKLQGNTIKINNNLKWHSLGPKNTQRDQQVKLWSFTYSPEDEGKVRMCFVGDSQFHFQEAQDLKRSLDVAFGRDLKFVGKHLDNNGYRFHAYNQYTLYDLKRSLDEIPESDYFLVNIGTNEWKKPVAEKVASLEDQIGKLHKKYPAAKILVHTIMPPSTLQRDQAERLLWVKEYNGGIRNFVNALNSEKIKLIDLEEQFQPANDLKWFNNDGVHLSALFYSKYQQLISSYLAADSKLSEAFTGVTEDFESFPLTDKLAFHNNSNTTAAGYYKLVEANAGMALRAELQPTVNLKAPHRSEMTMYLDPYYQDDKMAIAIDFMVPNNWQLDSDNVDNQRRVMILQIHSKPEEGQTWEYYQKNLPFNRPAIALYITTRADGIYAELYYGLNGKPGTEFADRKWARVASIPLELDKWNTFNLKYKLAFDDSGFLEASLNDIPMITGSVNGRAYGANMHNKAKPYLKFGQYRYWADSNTHQVLFDNLKVGNREIVGLD